MSAAAPFGAGRRVLFRLGADPHPVRPAHRAVVALAALQHRRLGGIGLAVRADLRRFRRVPSRRPPRSSPAWADLSRRRVDPVGALQREAGARGGVRRSAMSRRCSPCWARCMFLGERPGAGPARGPGAGGGRRGAAGAARRRRRPAMAGLGARPAALGRPGARRDPARDQDGARALARADGGGGDRLHAVDRGDPLLVGRRALRAGRPTDGA